MKRRILPLAIAGVAVTALLPTPARADPRPGAWTRVWSDEFSCGSLATYPDSNNWGYESGYVRNKEWQYYTQNLENAYCKDGLLHIEAHKHPAGTYPSGSYAGQDGTISSASLVSKAKVEHRYGWLEIRARIDTRLGSWPAFWTLGASGEWPDNGECDVLEFYQSKLLFNIAWWRTGDRRWTARWDSATVNLSSLAPEWASDFHVWSMEWTPAEVRLYLDGLLYNTWDASQDSGDRSIQGFQQPHYMIINQAIGGSAGGDASGLSYPTNYEIDWVRWYQDETNYVDDEGGAVAYAGTWSTWSGNPGYRRTEHFSETAGSEATFTFTGDKAWYYGFKRDDLGIAEIYLDGAASPVDTIDLYSSTANYFVSLYETPAQLNYGPHTLKVRVTGRKNPASSGTEIIVDGFGYTGSAGSVNQAPLFTSDPVVEANAVKGKAYVGSISNHAVDADGDPLVFSKRTGPAWLVIASDGGLSGTPSAVDMGVNVFVVEVVDGRGGTAQAGLQITVVAAGKSRR